LRFSTILARRLKTKIVQITNRDVLEAGEGPEKKSNEVWPRCRLFMTVHVILTVSALGVRRVYSRMVKKVRGAFLCDIGSNV